MGHRRGTPSWVVLCCLALGAAIPVATGCHDVKAVVNKALGRYRAYDPKASGKSQLAAAMQQAHAEHKRILVQFGGNWCVFCKALDELIATTPQLSMLRDSYVNVHIDSATNEDLNQQYGNPFRLGFPVLLVLDESGALLHTQASTELQLPAGQVGHDAPKVQAFLAAWQTPAH